MVYDCGMFLNVYGIFDTEQEAIDKLQEVLNQENSELDETEHASNTEIFWFNSRVEEVSEFELVILKVFIDGVPTENIWVNDTDGMDGTINKYMRQESEALYIVEDIQELIQDREPEQYNVVNVYFDSKYNYIKTEF